MSETMPKLVVQQVKPDHIRVVAPHVLDLVEKASSHGAEPVTPVTPSVAAATARLHLLP